MKKLAAILICFISYNSLFSQSNSSSDVDSVAFDHILHGDLEFYLADTVKFMVEKKKNHWTIMYNSPYTSVRRFKRFTRDKNLFYDKTISGFRIFDPITNTECRRISLFFDKNKNKIVQIEVKVLY